MNMEYEKEVMKSYNRNTSEIKKKQERIKYAKNPDAKKRRERLSYAKNPDAKKKGERQKYVENPDAKKKRERQKYVENPDAKKKRERQKYVENPEVMKKRERQKYMENPDAKKKRERQNYVKNSEVMKKRKRQKYMQNPEVMKKRKRQKYMQNPEVMKKRERQKYMQNPDVKKKRERQKYVENPDIKKQRERHKYVENPDIKKQRERQKYVENPDIKKQRVRKRYREHLDYIRFKRKERYMLKVSSMKKGEPFKFVFCKQGIRTAHQIISKSLTCLRKKLKRRLNISETLVKNIRKRHLRKMAQNSFSLKEINTEILAQNIAKILKIGKQTSKLLEGKSVIKWCLYAHKKHKRIFSKTFKKLKAKCSDTLNKTSSANSYKDRASILCGPSLHTKNSEPYYYDFSYKTFQNREKKIILNKNHQAINIFSYINDKKNPENINWECSDEVCDIENENISHQLEKILKCITSCNLKKGFDLSIKLNDCSNNFCNRLTGHSLSCYRSNGCKSFLPYLRTLTPHFPKLRTFLRSLYQLSSVAHKMHDIKSALQVEDENQFSLLQKIAETTRNEAKEFEFTDTSEECFKECQILNEYKNAFIAVEKRSLDVPKYPCFSCERLCFKRQVSNLRNLKQPLQGRNWDALTTFKSLGVDEFICRTCLEKFRKNILPAMCIVNALYVHPQPEEIMCLNNFEKILIQRAKAFQVVTSMDSIGKKHRKFQEKIKKVKGRTFHLPLPLEETLKKLPNPQDPINLNHELHILVRGIPTKNKILWESLVDINKVFNALQYLKQNNHLYQNINLPSAANDLFINVEKTVFFADKKTLKEKSPCEKRAILTQVDTNEWEADHLEYTIHTLTEIKSNETASGLYKLVRVPEEPIDWREKNIDLLCFPDLYVTGEFGQHHDRKIKLTSSEFIKSRLTSKHPQFRLNQQYIFYLLHDANLRQLQQGIFHKLNVTNLKGHLTAEECLKNISTGNLEGDLTSIFGKLRNTSQYWIRPRNDVMCMTYHYGPATWFLTMSPSEWNWDDLALFIVEINSSVKDISKKSTSELVAFDPVSASRFIDNKFRGMLDFILSEDAPLGKVIHYFYRREYQNRGLQHFHLLLWVENAPVLGISSNEDVAKFINTYLTCKLPNENICPTLFNRVHQYQMHHHNSYCMRSKKVKSGFIKVCRFGFPRPVSNSLVLRDTVEAVAARKSLKSKGRLYDLKRSSNEKYINDYNAAVLMAWIGNVDLQYVGEKSTILNWYLTKYTTKSENSHEKSTFNQINSTKSLSSRLFNIGLRALNNRECGSLEAADTLLGIPLYGTDPDTTIKWLDVGMIRNKRLKPYSTLKNLNADSTNICYESVVDDFYPNRPPELENISLYDFARQFDVKTSAPKSSREIYRTIAGKYLVKRSNPYIINHYKYNFKQATEKYYFSLLLMFKPWRNIAELKENFDSYVESFCFHKKMMQDAVKYDKKTREIEMAFESTKDLVRQKIEDDKKFKENSTSQNNNEIDTDIVMDDMKLAMNDISPSKDLENSFQTMYISLNEDQRRVFDHVTSMIANSQNSDLVLRHFVSGVGGTGKSFLIKIIRTWIKIKMKDGSAAVSAPTGLSAYNISGTTIYKLFQLPVEHGHTARYRPVSDDVLKMLREELQNVILFIIDEISMVSNITFLYIHLRLTEIFNTTDVADGWFGKKHILLFGDLLQLPPVHEGSPFTPIASEHMTKYVGSLTSVNLWTELFSYDELTINMRQAEDNKFAQVLENIRIGKLEKSDEAFLNKRKIILKSENAPDRLKEIGDYFSKLPFETIALCATGSQCTQINQEMLSRLHGDEITIVAKDSIDCKPQQREKIKKMLLKHEYDSTRTAGMEKTIKIKRNAKVMLRRNIDVKLGLVNSAIGIILEIKKSIENPNDVDSIKISLSNGIVHDLERVTSKFEIAEGAFIYREQFPLTLAYSFTIHKSQGLSLKSILLDIGESVFSCGQTYVALSRVTSSRGLHLINFNPANIVAQKDAIEEYNRLRLRYRPDLPQITKTNCKKKTYIRDRRWHQSTLLQGVQENDNFVAAPPEDITSPTENLNIIGFPNDDAISCYSNSVIQCLYSSKKIRFIMKTDPSISIIFKNHLKLYESHTIQNTKILRESLNSIYESTEQQDCVQFLEDLLLTTDCLKSAFTYTQKVSLICSNCKYTQVNEVPETIARLSINSTINSLEGALKINFGRWEECQDYTCSFCGCTGQTLRKCEITFPSDHIVLQFLVFDNQLNKIKYLRLKGVPNCRLKIDNQLYRPLAAVFHHGQTINEGHYVALVKRNRQWFSADDSQVKKSRWPRESENIYMILMSRQ